MKQVSERFRVNCETNLTSCELGCLLDQFHLLILKHSVYFRTVHCICFLIVVQNIKVVAGIKCVAVVLFQEDNLHFSPF